MSYCRWSSDNFQCDLYCYQSEEGYETRVASFKQRGWVRAVYFLTDSRVKICGDTHRFSRHWVNRIIWSLPHHCTHRRLVSPLAGKSFCDDSEFEMFERILGLSRAGLHVPTGLLKLAEKELAR